MDNQFTVTIHDDNGMKQLNLHNVIKKVLLYSALFLVSLFVIGGAIIVYLNDSVDAISQKEKALESNLEALNSKNEELIGSILEKQKALDGKKNELLVVSDKLNDIEELIGLSHPENSSLTQRVDIAKLSSEQMNLIMQYIPNGSPIEYHGITSRFGYREHPTLNRREFHRGSDMKAKMNTAIYAPSDAIVEFAGPHKSSGYGRLIILDHNYGFKTLYGHLSKVAVKSGTFISKGDLIGYTGNSGMSNGPHLHYEVRFVQRALNPFWFIKWTYANYNQIFEKETKVPWLSLITAITAHQQLNPATTILPSLPKEQLSRAK